MATKIVDVKDIDIKKVISELNGKTVDSEILRHAVNTVCRGTKVKITFTRNSVLWNNTLREIVEKNQKNFTQTGRSEWLVTDEQQVAPGKKKKTASFKEDKKKAVSKDSDELEKAITVFHAHQILDYFIALGRCTEYKNKKDTQGKVFRLGGQDFDVIKTFESGLPEMCQIIPRLENEGWISRIREIFTNLDLNFTIITDGRIGGSIKKWFILNGINQNFADKVGQSDFIGNSRIDITGMAISILDSGKELLPLLLQESPTDVVKKYWTDPVGQFNAQLGIKDILKKISDSKKEETEKKKEIKKEGTKKKEFEYEIKLYSELTLLDIVEKANAISKIANVKYSFQTENKTFTKKVGVPGEFGTQTLLLGESIGSVLLALEVLTSLRSNEKVLGISKELNQKVMALKYCAITEQVKVFDALTK